MKPPYSITSAILKKVASISEKIGTVKTAYLTQPSAQLRKENRIKTIQSSLEIEGNTLTEEQITDILDGKRVLAPEKDILEVKNAITVYQQIQSCKPYYLTSLCKAHQVLMKGLVENAGQLRTTGAGVMKGSKVMHMAPPARFVREHLEKLFAYAKSDKDLLLIKSCVFHYEFEFIHPFVDGNGRMGRLWQTILLCQQYPVFEFLPVENLIKKRQQDYYRALSASDKKGDCTAFIEFMLTVIDDSLEDLLNTQPVHPTGDDRMEMFRTTIKNASFSRKEYMRHLKDISTATASRDLKLAVEQGILQKTGDGRVTVYRFNKK